MIRCRRRHVLAMRVCGEVITDASLLPPVCLKPNHRRVLAYYSRVLGRVCNDILQTLYNRRAEMHLYVSKGASVMSFFT